MKKPKRNSGHRYLGRMTVHHLVPTFRIKVYYGTSFRLPKNKLRLWELKHAAWHVLFGLKTINEIIRDLKRRNMVPKGYQGPAWKLLFKEKTRRQVLKLLVRVRRMVRKKYQFLEFDPSLQRKVRRIYKHHHRPAARIYLHKRFRMTG